MDAISSITNSQSAYSADGSDRAARFKKLMEASAQYLGLSTDDLRTQLQSGKSLADITNAEGKSVDGLKQALQAALPSLSNQGVDATSATQGSNSSSSLDKIINGHPGGHHHHHHHHVANVQSNTSTTGSSATDSVNVVA